LNPDEFNKLIGQELKRQIRILLDHDSSVDGKIGIFLGFEFLVFIQVVLLGGFVLRLSSLELRIYAVGLGFIFLSIVICMFAYFSRRFRDYPVGVDIPETVLSYARGEGWDYKREIQKSMLMSYGSLKLMAEKKIRYMQRAAGLFALGIIVLTALAFCSIYSMV
jgi:hypothetical protein